MKMLSPIGYGAVKPVQPTKVRKALGPAIEYVIGESELGHALVAQTAHGVCAILLGSNAGQLTQDLVCRFPRSELTLTKSKLKSQLAEIVQFVKAPRRGLDLKLDMRGTPFQKRVWTELRNIPIGKTVTYSDLARQIGMPNGARAVASACANNPIALAVPCHRVVRHDGHPSGYRWGIERKRALIEKEANA